MKGKTKGERKNKSIKKNQIPAFILTGGEIKEYSDFVNNDNQNYKDAMEHAANEVEKKLKICNENAVRLQQLKEQETTNMTKLAELVQTLQTSQVENKSKINECNTIKDTLEKANAELTRLQNIEKENSDKITEIDEQKVMIDKLTEQLKDAKIQHETQTQKNVAQNLVGTSISQGVTNIANEEIDNKIKTLEEENTRLNGEITSLTRQNEELKSEKDIVNEGIKKTEGDLTNIQNELNASNANNNKLAGVISAHYDNLKQILQDQTTIVKEGVDGEGTQGNIDDSPIKDLEISGTKLKELSDKIEQLMATNQEHSEANKTVRSENKQLKEANATLEADKAKLEQEKNEIAQGTHESLSNITNKIAAEEQNLLSIKGEKENAEGIIKQSKEATSAVQQAQEELQAIQTQAEQAKLTINDAVAAQEAAQKEKAEAEAAKADAEAAKEELAAVQLEKDALQEAENAKNSELASAQEQKEVAESAKKQCEEKLAAEKKAKEECQEELEAAENTKKYELEQKDRELKGIARDNETALTDLEKQNNQLQKENERLTDGNVVLEKAFQTSHDNVKQLNEQLAKSVNDCDERVAQANAEKMAGEQREAQDMEPKYEDNIETINVDEIDKNTYDNLDRDVKTIIDNSVSSVDDPRDNPNDVSDMDYIHKRDANNISSFVNSDINKLRKDYHLNTYNISNGMLFLFVHDKIESMGREIYICKIDKIDNTNITADCWNISTSMNGLLNNYKHNEYSPNYHESKVTINPHDSNPINFSTIPHRGKHNKQLPKIYKELLTPIIHKGVVKDKGKKQNQNIYMGNHATNGNLSGEKEGKLIGIKNQNIIPVYPYGQDSYNLLRRSFGDSSFQKSKNYIIYLTDYERIIKNEDKNKYFPVKENKDATFTMFFRNSVEIRYLHALIENAKRGFLKQDDQKTLNTHAETGFQKQQNDKKPQQEKTHSQLHSARIIKSLTGQRGGKKNLTKEYMKGGYRYSALGMKGLTIDLSGLKGKKTRRVKKKGKTVKNKKGSRKVKKGSRKDKTKKNKRRGRTYRNKNNFF
jgi:chromosome segregation ATPase